MKTKYFILLALAAISFAACNKNQKQSAQSLLKNADVSMHFSKTTGKIFPKDTIAKWISSYNQVNRTSQSSCIFNSADIINLCSTSNASGVMFYNISVQNNWALIAIGVNTEGTLLKTDSVQSSGSKLSWSEAMSLKNDFQASNPNAIWGEFFGSTTLTQLITQNSIQDLQVVHGINSKGLRLILVNGASQTYTDQGGGGAEDGQMCPPICH
jgi:hypothetical protein